MRQQTEVEFMVFARPAFWWLEYYSSFALYLDAHFNCLLRNNLVIVFDLRTTKAISPRCAAQDYIDRGSPQEQYG
jgi:hypothetical protein